MSMRKVQKLFLEQRVAYARCALNEQTRVFHDALPKLRQEFWQFILDVMEVLDGDPYGGARKRLKLEPRK